MIWLAIEAPFAACRPMTAGWHRPTAGFLTHSAVYGLILNVAGIESRLGEHEPGHPGSVPASVTRSSLPAFRLALGIPEGADLPHVGTIFQQLHSYSVNSGNAGIKPEFALGRKNNIAPVRREFLSGLHGLPPSKPTPTSSRLSAVVSAASAHSGHRYGLPFLGDNNLTLDHLDEIQPHSARWFALADSTSGEPPRAGTTRLSAYIDRLTPVGTRSALFAPTKDVSKTPPESSLVPVGDPMAFDQWASRHRGR